MANQGNDGGAKDGGGKIRPEARSSNRARKRLMVRYGIEAAKKTAFTKNVSSTGLCLGTNQVFTPGTTLQVEIQTPDRTFSLWARVVWAKKVPQQLAHVLDCGMGIRLIDPSAEWVDFAKRWAETV